MMSKKIYIGIYAASLSVFLLIGMPAIVLALFENFTIDLIHSLGMKVSTGMLLIYAAAILTYLQFALIHVIYNFLVLAKMWGVIQDGQTLVTVGQAIGYLFIPFFNLYWIFRAWGNYPKEYNTYIERYGLPVPILSSGVFIAYPIVLLLSGLLYVPIIVLPFIFLYVVAKTCDVVNKLKTAEIERRNQVILKQPGNQYAPRI